MNEENKTHYRKAFNSPYLSSADIVGATTLTISHVTLSKDETRKTKDVFNTAHFVEKELRKGEALKPMILNAGNSQVMKDLTGSYFIDDWNNVPVTIFVDHNVRFGRETVEGLRISPQPPALEKPSIEKTNVKLWEGAKKAFIRDGNFDAVLKRANLSDENKRLIVEEINNV